jgi:chemotaxis protein CheD
MRVVDLAVDIADFAVTDDPRVTIVTHSLGSCIGVTIWDPQVRVGGMIHYMLPESSLSPDKAKANPAMFADTGIPELFRAAYELGAAKNRLIIKVAGGSQLLDDNGTFNIGKRNYTMLRKLFWKNGVLIDAEDVGGSKSRTLRLAVHDGCVTLKTREGEVEL